MGIVTGSRASESVGSELRLEIPGDPANLRVVRLVAADAAARAGFDCDRADDLRIAVDELCHALMASTRAPVTVRFGIADGNVEVQGNAARVGTVGPFVLGRLSGRIVHAISQTFELIDAPSELGFELRMSADRGVLR